jgi:hypothetical protein
MAYEITSFDVCAQGNERLRNQDEFLLVASVWHDMTKDMLREQFIDDIQACERPEGFDFEACRVAVNAAVDGIDMTRALQYVEPTAADDDGDGISAYLFVRDV